MGPTASDSVKLEIEIPQRLFDTFAWYMRMTHYWVNEDHAEKSYNACIVDIIRQYLQCEADSGIPDSRDHIIEELEALLKS